MPASIYMFGMEGRLDWSAIPRYIHKVVFVGEWQLWFLLAMAIGYFIISFLLSRGFSRRQLLIVGSIMFIAEWCIEFLQSVTAVSDFPTLIEKIVTAYNVIFASPRVLFQALPYLSLSVC